jgi:uncharacterized protein (DUF1499 family)
MRSRFVAVAFAVVLALPPLLLVAGQAGLLRGTPPADLGVRDGRLKPPAATPNSVSSQAALYGGAAAASARIAPLHYDGDGAAAFARLRGLVAAMPGARIVAARPDYLYVQFTTRWLHFVDDAEFWWSPAEGVIHVRSAARLGESDLGVNRARIEALRARFEQP